MINFIKIGQNKLIDIIVRMRCISKGPMPTIMLVDFHESVRNSVLGHVFIDLSSYSDCVRHRCAGAPFVQVWVTI